MPTARIRTVGLVGRACATGIVMLVLFAPASPALAHNSLETSTPADGATLVAAPTEWVLDFTSDVPLESASGEVVAADGTRTSLAAPTHGNDASIVRFAFPRGLSGTVTARWRLVNSDGHVVSGRVAFGITAASVTTGPSVPSPGSTVVGTPGTTVDPVTSSPAGLPSPVRWLFRWAAFAATIVLGGILFTELSLAPGIISDPRARRWAIGAASTAAAAALLQLLQFTVDVEEVSLAGALWRFPATLSHVPAAMLMLRVVIGAVLVAGLGPANPRERTDRGRLLAVLYLMSLVALAWVGHSRSRALPWIGIPVDVVHTGAVAVWLGGLLVVAVLLAPSMPPSAGLATFARFGDVARIAVPVIVGTGVVQSLRIHGGPVGLFSTSHGRLLLLKLCIVALMLRVADINRGRVARTADADDRALARRRGLLVRASLTELGLGVAVLAVTAALVAANPD